MRAMLQCNAQRPKSFCRCQCYPPGEYLNTFKMSAERVLDKQLTLWSRTWGSSSSEPRRCPYLPPPFSTSGRAATWRELFLWGFYSIKFLPTLSNMWSKKPQLASAGTGLLFEHPRRMSPALFLQLKPPEANARTNPMWSRSVTTA